MQRNVEINTSLPAVTTCSSVETPLIYPTPLTGNWADYCAFSRETSEIVQEGGAAAWPPSREASEILMKAESIILEEAEPAADPDTHSDEHPSLEGSSRAHSDVDHPQITLVQNNPYDAKVIESPLSPPVYPGYDYSAYPPEAYAPELYIAPAPYHSPPFNSEPDYVPYPNPYNYEAQPAPYMAAYRSDSDDMTPVPCTKRRSVTQYPVPPPPTGMRHMLSDVAFYHAMMRWYTHIHDWDIEKPACPPPQYESAGVYVEYSYAEWLGMVDEWYRQFHQRQQRTAAKCSNHGGRHFHHTHSRVPVK